MVNEDAESSCLLGEPEFAVSGDMVDGKELVMDIKILAGDGFFNRHSGRGKKDAGEDHRECRNFRRIFHVMLLVCAVFLVFPFSTHASASKLKRDTFPKKETVYSKVTKTYKVTIPEGEKASNVRWITSDSEIAVLRNKKGKTCRVRFLKSGKVTISCYIKGKKKETGLKCRVTVKTCRTKIKKIKFSKQHVSLYVGDTYRNNLSTTPKKIKKRQLKYTSSNRAVAAVSSDGVVTAKGAGKAVIKAVGIDGSGKSCSFTVYVNTISAAQTTVAMYVGETYASSLNGLIYGTDASDVVWTSSDPAVVKINDSGGLTAVGIGTATIRAAVANAASQSTSFRVTVSYRIKKDSTHFIAHRGLSSKAPENTLRAFILAGEAGFWGAETDIHKTKDGHFVLQHDDNLKRMCGDSRIVEEMTLEEVKNARVISGSNYMAYKDDALANTIPTLEEYLNVCIQYNMVPVIEIKMKYDHELIEKQVEGQEGTEWYDPEEEDMKALFAVVDSIMGSRPYVFIDFDAETLVKLKGIIPEAKLSQITFQCLSDDFSSSLQTACKTNGFDYSLNHLRVSLNLVKSLRNGGAHVGLWTVDTRAKAEEVLMNGIDYLTTDYLYW